VYSPNELNTALHGGATKPTEASMMPLILEIRNHKSVVEYVREEARSGTKKSAQITLTEIKRMHDLFSGNTPEALAARALMERREKTEKELAKEEEKGGYRFKDTPLHRAYFHQIAPSEKIPALLEKLVHFTESAEFRELHPIEQAATVQHQFLHIFPFAEHSGKIGRMCSNLIQLRHHYLPCVIHSIDRQKYYESFRGPVASFRLLLVDAMDNSLDNALKYFRGFVAALPGDQLALLIGAHISVAGGVSRAFERARSYRAKSLQGVNSSWQQLARKTSVFSVWQSGSLV
jgi:Fic family protein